MMQEHVELPFTTKEEFEKYINDCPKIPNVSWEMSMDYMTENSFMEKNMRGDFEVDLTFTPKAFKKLKEDVPQFRSKIPGMRAKSSIPNSSSILASEMFKLFHIAQRLSTEENLSKDEMAYWNELSQKVAEEQENYMRFAWLQWLRAGPKKHSQILPEVMEYVNTIWKMKLERIYDYPNCYGNPMVIPLHTDDFKERCQLNFLSPIKQIGRKPMMYYFPNLKLSPVNAKSVLLKLKSDLDLLDKERDDGWPKYKRRFEKDLKYHPDVSKDEEAKSLAYEHDVQLVSSSSAFSALVNILGPESSWDIPVVVKEVDGANGKKKIIFLDKKLPPKSMNVVDRQKFYMKKALKKLFLRSSNQQNSSGIAEPCLSCSKPYPNPVLETNVNYIDDWGGDDDDDDEDKLLIDDTEGEEKVVDETNRETLVPDKIEERLVIDDDNNEEKKQDNNEIKEKLESENPNRELIQSVVHDLLTNTTPKCNCIRKKKKSLNYMVEYNLWDLKSNEENNVLLKKSKLKDLKLIIRTTHEGCNRFDRGSILNTKLSAKLEYQPEYGAETVTLNESLRDWSSVFIRKGSFLTRVRVDPLIGEVIQFEKKNIASLTKECQRLHEINPYDLITHIHIIFDKLTNLAPGNYLLNHEPESHQCVTVFKATDNRHTLNLRLKYGTVNTAESGHLHAQFLRLDTNIITPVFYNFRRVPCCFAPTRFDNRKTLPQKRPLVPPKKKRNRNKKNNQ